MQRLRRTCSTFASLESTATKMTKLLLKTFVKNADNINDKNVRKAYGTLGGATGIVCNFLLFAAKFTIGAISGSLSVIADAFNNLSDMGSSVIVLLGYKIASKPADRKHPFGHGRIEYMSAFAVSVLIIMVGAELLKASVEKIFTPAPQKISAITIAVPLLSIGVKLWMRHFNLYLAKRVDSAPLVAAAQDSFNDCITTFAVLVSLIVYRFTNINTDGFVGTAVAVFILIAGIGSAVQTLSPLLGEPPSAETIKKIKDTISEYPEFLGIHDLIVHSYGPGRSYASVHVEVSDKINIVYCHEKVDECELKLKDTLGIDVVIHTDPITTDDATVTALKSAVTDTVKSVNENLSIHDFRVVEGEKRTNLIFDILVPIDFKMSDDDIVKSVCEKIAKVNRKYKCVINIDYDYTAR